MNITEKHYEINDCGVVINPCKEWRFMPKNALAWLYWEIRVGKCDNGLWDFGYSYAGGGSPVSLGRFNTKEEAVENGIGFFKEYFKRPYTGGGMYKEKDLLSAKKSFNAFVQSYFFKNQEIILSQNFNQFQGEQMCLF